MRRQTLILLTVAMIISLLGISSIYSSTFQKENLSWQTTYQRQIVWVVFGAVLFFLTAQVPYRRLWVGSYVLYALVLILLVLVFLLGTVRLGAQRWLRFAWFNFQPSEIAKLVMVILLARYYSLKSVDSISPLVNKSGIWRGLVVPFAITAIPMFFIIEQPDLGSAVMIYAVFVTMVYLSGIRLRYILLLVVFSLLALPLVWFILRDYQKERLLVFLNPNVDPLGAGYTVIQSRIAIGSGGIFGKGWLSGTQSQLRFLPESHTDFIFATFAEERGLVGCLVLLGLYYFLITRGIRIANRTPDSFAKLLAFGISVMIGIQACVNIAMNLGLAPVVGLPLPLMSYGGSSVLTTFIALGILASINKTRGVF